MLAQSFKCRYLVARPNLPQLSETVFLFPVPFIQIHEVESLDNRPDFRRHLVNVFEGALRIKELARVIKPMKSEAI